MSLLEIKSLLRKIIREEIFVGQIFTLPGRLERRIMAELVPAIR